MKLLKIFVSSLKALENNMVMNLAMKHASVENTLECVGFGKLSQHVLNNEEEHVKNLLTAALEIHLASDKECHVVNHRYIEKYSPDFVFFDVRNFSSYLSRCSFMV